MHELIDHLEPEQAKELRRHALRLVKPAPSRFRILRTFDGPAARLGARAKEAQPADKHVFAVMVIVAPSLGSSWESP